MKYSCLFVWPVCLGCRKYYEAPVLKITPLDAKLMMDGCSTVTRYHLNRLIGLFAEPQGPKTMNLGLYSAKRCYTRVWNSGYGQGHEYLEMPGHLFTFWYFDGSIIFHVIFVMAAGNTAK